MEGFIMDIKRPGIYKIENAINGNCYVGGTKNLQGRRRQHFSDLKLGKSTSKKMQQDYNIFGRPCFTFIVIEFVDNINNLVQQEQKWMDALKPVYNTNEVAGRYVGDYVRTEEANRKRVETVKKLWENPEYKAKHCKPRNWKNGIPNRKGVKLSEETREKIRQANLGENNPNYGLHRSKETKLLMSEKMAKTYVGAISPEGEVFAPIHHMRNFCKEHSLCESSMVALMRGRIKHHKGWTRFGG